MGRSWGPPEGKRGSSGQVNPFHHFVPSPFDLFFASSAAILLEKDLKLIGVTAIEDKLQDG